MMKRDLFAKAAACLLPIMCLIGFGALAPAKATSAAVDNGGNTFVPGNVPVCSNIPCTSLVDGGVSPSTGIQSWTPTLAGSSTAGVFTCSSKTGHFVNNGGVVTAFLDIEACTVTGTAPTGSIVIKSVGLPANGNSNENGCVWNVLSGVSLDTGFTQFGGSPDGAPMFYLSELGATSGGSVMSVSRLSGTFYARGYCTYHQ